MQFIDLQAQYRQLEEGINARIRRVLDHGRYILGPEVTELEERLAEYVGVGHCIGISSGTDALLVSLMALEIGPGDEVITTPFTFIATGEAIVLLGARPVFVDIDPRTYNLDPERIEPAITPRTRAILPVGLYGQCAEMDAIDALARRHGLPVIEDAAQSFGARYRGRRSCALSTIGCTSFFPSKPLGSYGDGGACFTDDAALAARIRQLSVHGQDRRYHHPRIGINGRLDTLQAAVLLAKLDTFPDEVAARERIGGRYTEHLADSVQVPYIEPHNRSVYAQYTIQVPQRDAFAARLQEAGIPTAVHYPLPLTSQPALADPHAEVPHATAAAERVLSLPMSPWLTESDQDRVIARVRAVQHDMATRQT
ncbi:MAG: DegT/DnrJ/EryC1/StrS family aminotransferase [Candidatus Thiosymbion ectosymbiont of Robbea hypermnestra]|nr:DegT/DnrJ/EryC1/StrS family aminotransferase [Candidatus Thiosymbion ectosymbiont of Robbea hypermnestra]